MHIHVPTGEGSSHSTVISHIPHPLEEDRDFWTMGETVKHVVSPHDDKPSTSTQGIRKEIREILVGSIAILIEGGPTRFDVVPSRRSSKIITPQPRNIVDVHPMSIRNIEGVPESVNRNRFPTKSQVLIQNVMFPKMTCMQTLKMICMQTLKVISMQTLKVTCMTSKHYLMMHAPN